MGNYSVIDGLWLEHALNPSGMWPDEVMEIAMDLSGRESMFPFLPAIPPSGPYGNLTGRVERSSSKYPDAARERGRVDVSLETRINLMSLA